MFFLPNLIRQQKIYFMKKIRLSTNFTIFLLFFGVGALEAFQTKNWPKVAFWIAIGIVFLLSDNLKKNAKG